MAPTILVAGATGNTGRATVETLSKLLGSNHPLSGHRILALTRSSKGTVAQNLAKLPHVEVLEQNWVEITADWLRKHEVVRAFIAPHFQPNQFTEESAFHLAALQAGVQYVVRVSTSAPNIRPDAIPYHGRQHWAVETLLGSPEFEALKWTSLQPNTFSTQFLAPVAQHIKQYRQTGKQDTLRLTFARDVPVAIIHPDDVGVFAANLLASSDPAAHNRAKYVMNGPEDITGEQLVKLAEQHMGVPVQDVVYKDMSFVDQWAAALPESKHTILTIKRASDIVWDGKCSLAVTPTSKQVLEIAPPTHKPADVLKSLLEE